MKAFEFTSSIENNSIEIPKKIQSALGASNKEVKVILLLLEENANDEDPEKQNTVMQFFKGYSDSDSIYDNG